MDTIGKNIFINEYSKYLKDGKASLFIGSGISRQAGYAGWADILKGCADEIGLEVDKENLITLAEFYVKRNQRTRINETIKEFFAEDKGCPARIHKIISTLPIKDIWTTNYDNLLERSFKSRDMSYSVVTDDKSYTNINRNSKVVIHKIHGTVDNVSKCVITRTDYEKFEQNHDIVLSELKGEMCTNSFLFLGYSFSDVDIQHILSKIRLTYDQDNPQRHYCIMKRVSEEDAKHQNLSLDYLVKRQDHYIDDMKSYSINTILVEKYDDIADILNKVSVKVHIKDVYISGAFEENSGVDENRIIKTAELLSQELIKDGNKIFTGYGKNLGPYIVSGAFKECGNGPKAKDFNENVMILPFPYRLPENVNRGEIYTKIRENTISKTHISIFICGNKFSENNIVDSPGCMEEYQISKNLGNLIIPVGSTGGAAMTIWDLENKHGSIISESEQFQKLRTEINPDAIVKLIMKIINDYQNK